MFYSNMANYFSHDSNARNDEKLVRLRMRHKAAGYGVYFMLLERMRDAKDYMCVKDYNIIAFDLREDAGLIKSVVEDFGLFVFTEDGKYFYSESFLRRMKVKDGVSQKRSEAGRKGMNRRWSEEENAAQTDNKTITSKEKKSKVNNIPSSLRSEGLSDGNTVRTRPESFRDVVIDYFNQKMAGRSIKPIKAITDGTKRAEHLKTRVREYGREAIFLMIDKAAASKFLNGYNKKGFTATFDWLILPNNFIKVLEGNYDNQTSRTDYPAEQTVSAAAAAVQELLAGNQ